MVSNLRLICDSCNKLKVNGVVKEQVALTRQQFEAVKTLLKIQRQLHKMDEDTCNVNFSEAQQVGREKRYRVLVEKATQCAALIGYKSVFHQSDPRGCSLWLLNRQPHENPTQVYTNGLAIY